MPRAVCRILISAAAWLAAAWSAAEVGAVLHRHTLSPGDPSAAAGAPLGDLDGVRHYHVLTLNAPAPGAYRILYALDDPDAAPALWAAPLGNAALGDPVIVGGTLAFDVRAQAGPARILVGHCGAAWAGGWPSVAPRAAGALACVEPGARPAPAGPECVAGADAPAALLDRLRPRRATPGEAERHRVLDRAEDRAALDAELRRAYGGERPADPAARAHAILAHVAQRLRLEADAAPTGSAVLARGGAYCHGMALAFAALCRRAGLPARVNAVYNSGLMQSHNMAEVWLDGAWRLVDPTYGLRFDPPLDGLRALCLAGGAGMAATQVDAPLWTGAPVAAGWRAPPPDARHGEWPFTLEAFHRAVFALGDPVLSDGRAAGVFRIALDLADGPAWAGRVDGSLADQFPKDAAGALARHGGAPVLGRMGLGEALILLDLAGVSPGRVAVAVHGLPGADAGGRAHAFNLAGPETIDVEIAPPGLRLAWETTGDHAAALIGLADGSLPIDALHAAQAAAAP